MIDGKRIAARLQMFAENVGATKIRMGEILGVIKSAPNQTKLYRHNSFFRNLRQNKLDISQITKLANAFGKPVEYFTEDQNTLYTSEKPHARPPASLEQVEQSLRELGYSDEVVRGMMTQMRAFKS